MSSAAVFACDMSAMSPDERASHSQVVRELFSAVEAIDVLPDGYRFTLPATTALLTRAAEFLALERLCCPFFDFAVQLPSATATLRLAITGPTGVQPFIQAEFGAALPRDIAFPSADQPSGLA